MGDTSQSINTFANYNPSSKFRFHCSVCPKEFMHISQLRVHELVHTDEKPFACNQCNKAFKRRSHLRMHLQSHSGEFEFACPVCSKMFSQSSDLRRHELIHSGMKPFECPECGKRFTERSKLHRHEAIHRRELLYSCSMCSQRFARKSHVNAHRLTHSTDNICSGSVAAKRRKNNKAVSAKSSESKESRGKVQQTDYFDEDIDTRNSACGFGSQVVRQQLNLDAISFAPVGAEASTTVADKPRRQYPCPHCGKAFTYCANLVRHQQKHNTNSMNELPPSDRYSQVYDCMIDQQGLHSELMREPETGDAVNTETPADKYDQSTELPVSVKIEPVALHNEIYNSYSQCDKGMKKQQGTHFEWMRLRAIDDALNTDIPVYKYDQTTELPIAVKIEPVALCNNNDKISNEYLNASHNHLSIGQRLLLDSMNEEQPFSACENDTALQAISAMNGKLKKFRFFCRECGKGFTHASLLRRHVVVHSGFRPFNCNECDKTFTRLDHLQHHQQSHSGKYRFSCSICSKKFAQSSDLRRHELIHSGDRPYSCTECEKRFVEESKLRRHMLIHRGERPHVCANCFRRFTQRVHLQAHLRTHSKCSLAVNSLEAVCNSNSKSVEFSICSDITVTSESGLSYDNANCVQPSASYDKEGFVEMSNAMLRMEDGIFFTKNNLPESPSATENKSCKLKCHNETISYRNGFEISSTIDRLKRLPRRKLFHCRNFYRKALKRFSGSCLKFGYSSANARALRLQRASDYQKSTGKNVAKLIKRETEGQIDSSTYKTNYYREPCQEVVNQQYLSEQPFTCGACSDTFSDIADLLAHEQTLCGYYNYVCSTCNAGFTKLSQLRKHELLQHTERNYKCNECGNAFAHIMHLRSHQQSHRTEPRYTCTKCSKRFAKLAGLRLHEHRVHSGDAGTSWQHV